MKLLEFRQRWWPFQAVDDLSIVRWVLYTFCLDRYIKIIVAEGGDSSRRSVTAETPQAPRAEEGRLNRSHNTAHAESVPLKRK
ncbi:hypothetical protein JOD21_003016 [Jeotgalibacillus terrae]|nr:hypothetical protein [Jeotgalibacillus terrae]